MYSDLIFFVYFQQRATSAKATTQFPTAGQTVGLTAGDRGCLPAVYIGPNLPQTATQQLTFGQEEADAGAIVADYALVVRLLCATSGTCCTTDLCNAMSRIHMSVVAILMSIALALFVVFNGF
jgi:hypothetical protein